SVPFPTRRSRHRRRAYQTRNSLSESSTLIESIHWQAHGAQTSAVLLVIALQSNLFQRFLESAVPVFRARVVLKIDFRFTHNAEHVQAWKFRQNRVCRI